MPKKETRYGPRNYVRRRLKNPITGKYQSVYGRTVAEREEKVRALQAAWAAEQEMADSPVFWQYAAAWYGREQGNMSPARRDQIAREINKNICPTIGGKLLKEITADDVAQVMAGRAGLSRSAQEKTLQTLKRILSAAERAGHISRNPAADLHPGGKPAAPREALTPEQQDALLRTVEGLPIDLLIRLGLFAGLRREEICGLAWKDVHLDGPAPYLDVRQACRWPRNNQPEISPVLKSAAAWRSIPIPPPLLSALREARKNAAGDAQEPPGAQTVLAGPDGQPWSYQSFRVAWDAVEARTARTVTRQRRDPATGETRPVPVTLALGDAVPKHPGVVISLDFTVTPHQLRHTYITRLVLGGLDVRRVQYLAGHESPQVTLAIYTHVMGHQPADLIDDITAVFPG